VFYFHPVFRSCAGFIVGICVVSQQLNNQLLKRTTITSPFCTVWLQHASWRQWTWSLVSS